jgi:signal transduction histidine kinase
METPRASSDGSNLIDGIDRACANLAQSADSNSRHLADALIELLQSAKRGCISPRETVEKAVLQRSAEEVQQMEAFLAVVAHELRNPIAPVVLGVEALIDEARSGVQLDRSRLLHRLEMIDRQLDRLRGELDRLLDFSRIRSGRLDLELEDVDLAEVASEVLREMRGQLEAAGCELVVSLETQRGRWDRLRLLQVIRNLISNAAKYAAGSPVKVRVAARDAHLVELSVADQGPGIPEHEREQVFRRFERTTTRRTGFGVGLWLVKRIVEAMDGGIELASTVGGGSTFKVTLPRVSDGKARQ